MCISFLSLSYGENGLFKITLNMIIIQLKIASLSTLEILNCVILKKALLRFVVSMG